MNSDWQTKAMQQLRQDPKKSAVLGSLFIVLLIMGARAIAPALNQPKPAAGALMPIAGTPPLIMASAPAKPTVSALRDWLTGPIPEVSRNVFVVRPEYFPLDNTKKKDDASDGGFWNELEKSLSQQADQKDKREALIASLKQQAAAIRPQSTVMGIYPRAMVDGKLVGEGDVVADFRVLKIEPRGIIVEQQGIRLEIPMKR